MTNPVLSAIIPTWNRAHLIGEAIESALSQRAGEVEVIVVDDGSTDDTVALITNNFGSRVRVLELETRRGPGAARNAGVLLASGEFVAFLDSDDLWLPGKLDAELRVFAASPEAIAVISDSENFFEGESDPASRFAQNGLLATTDGRVLCVDDCDWLWTNSTISAQTSGIIVRRKVLAQLGRTLFGEDVLCCEDWEFQLRLYHHGQVMVLPEIYSTVRRFNDGSRIGRGIPGRPLTTDHEITLLRARLTIIERSRPWLRGVRADLVAELERFRAETEARLAEVSLTNSEFSRKGAKAQRYAAV
ncbi:MAG TPA: glycosyltransferase [Pyrinomonadaceae bacterium]|nr:glycosyltransferase [Pyrinomonadaceae bacterium]